MYSEKATNFCEISTIDLSYVVTVKCTVVISQNFVAFSEYMNFNNRDVGSACWGELSFVKRHRYQSFDLYLVILLHFQGEKRAQLSPVPLVLH